MNSKKQNLLYVAAQFPMPATNGYTIRCINHIKYLSESYNIVLVCPHSPKIDTTHMQYVLEFAKEVVIAEPDTALSRLLGFPKMLLLIGQPLQSWLCYSGSLMNEVIYQSNKYKFDVAIVQLLRISYLISAVKADRIILDLIDSMYLNFNQRYRAEKRFFLRIVYKLESRLCLVRERNLLKKVSAITLVSEKDASFYNSKKVHVNTNGVSESISFAIRKPDKDRNVLFWGNMGYFANLSAAQFLENELAEKLNEIGINILVVGPNLKDKSKLKKVKFLGFINDLNSLFESGFAAVFPIFYSSGVQNKVLEAIAAGLPLIITQQIADPLNLINGRHCIVCETPKDFIEAVKKIEGDHKFSQGLAQCAKDEILPKYNWSRLSHELTKLS